MGVVVHMSKDTTSRSITYRTCSSCNLLLHGIQGSVVCTHDRLCFEVGEWKHEL